MSTFTSTFPNKLLNKKVKVLKMPKNKLIRCVLQLYLKLFDKAEFVRYYKQMAKDADVLHIAEECMNDYLMQ
jgi:hypothetical protein